MLAKSRSMYVLGISKSLLKLVRMSAKRDIYYGNHAIYPSANWFANYLNQDIHYQEVINPSMSCEKLNEQEVSAVKGMLNYQGKILQLNGEVRLLNPLHQTIEQYLFGVSDAIENKIVKGAVVDSGLVSGNEYWSGKYEFSTLQHELERSLELQNSSENIKLVNSVLNGVASQAMDSLYYANMWLHLGKSGELQNRPIVVLQSPKYHARQIERYYAIITCMALGVTPVQIGGDSHGKQYCFEGMADVLPVNDSNGNPLLICAHSSRTQVESYDNLRYIHQSFDFNQEFPEQILVEIKDELKDFYFHLDLTMHVDEYGNLYVGENILTTESEQFLIKKIGQDRIIFIPEKEAIQFGLNTILYDGRFGATRRIAITQDSCPILSNELSLKGYQLFSMKEAFPHGGGSARCRFAPLDIGKPHTLDSFLEEQSFIEEKLGADHAVVSSTNETIFRSIFDSSHLREVLHVDSA